MDRFEKQPDIMEAHLGFYYAIPQINRYPLDK